MIAPIFKQRLQDLINNIEKDQNLLKDFEDTLRYEDDPRRKTKYRRDIEELQKSVIRYQQEYRTLEAQMGLSEQSVEMQTIASQLGQMNGKLNLMLEGQVSIYQGLADFRQALLDRYTTTEQSIIKVISQQLTPKQLVLTQTLLDSLDGNQLSESEIQQLWAMMERKILALPPTQVTVAELIKDPTLDAKHKLKVSIPIIPLILDYEAELELGSGLNIRTVWETIKAQLWRK